MLEVEIAFITDDLGIPRGWWATSLREPGL